MTGVSQDQLQPWEQQLHHTPIPTEGLDTGKENTFFSAS